MNVHLFLYSSLDNMQSRNMGWSYWADKLYQNTKI